jgi:hypothetical protein
VFFRHRHVAEGGDQQPTGTGGAQSRGIVVLANAIQCLSSNNSLFQLAADIVNPQTSAVVPWFRIRRT